MLLVAAAQPRMSTEGIVLIKFNQRDVHKFSEQVIIKAEVHIQTG